MCIVHDTTHVHAISTQPPPSTQRTTDIANKHLFSEV